MRRLLLSTLALLLAGPAVAGEPVAAPAAEPAEPAVPAEVGPPPGILLDRVVAIVNDGIVTQSELDEAIATAVARARGNNITLPSSADALRRQVLDALIMDEIQWQRAQRIGIEASDEDVDTQLRRLAEENGLTLAQLPEVLARDGINYAAFRESQRKRIALERLRSSEVLNQVNITPRELDQFIERLKKLPDEQAEYNYSHILLTQPGDANQEQLDELARRADEISQRAASEDFAQLAATYSNSETALEGGQMGWVSGTQLPTVLAETIASMKPGEVSKPVNSSYGFHIVKLNQVRTAVGDPVQEQTHARHILLTTNALQDDATVALRLAGLRERVLAGEDFAVFASSMSEDPASAVNGGDLDWRGPGFFEPEFEAAMAPLKDGEISAPFQTEYGWHIVQVLGRRQFDVTEDMLRERAFNQLRIGKADQDLEIWRQQLRDQSFIDTDLN
ncbi:MAG TPA: peptidylprolyl isomerase [Steroidobacteraceae bacterium]|nr:peptidylprolyl isomerase [Steroidobacteraceae bacterium]